MPRTADSAPAPRLPFALGVIGLTCLAVITLAYPGSTRMFAWPWSLAYASALLAPALALLARSLDTQRPLVLPALPWTLTALATAATVLASSLLSPWSGPSLLWSAPLLSAVAVFFLLHDALHARYVSPTRLALLTGLAFALPLLTSLTLWLASLPGRSVTSIVDARNPFPLGHSNYTAGLALLALPWFGVLAWRTKGRARFAWLAALAVALLVLLSSGSRATLPAIGVLALATLVAAPIPRRRKTLLLLALPLAALAFAAAHPRTRAMFTRSDPAAAPNISNVQRSAMLSAAARMGADRPVLGSGPGTTPLAYPRYRAGLDGGAENVLQLHSTPAHLWAELGAAGLACALAFAVLALRAARRASILEPAALALLGYAVFALTDWQLDVPFLAFAVAVCLAHLAPPASIPAPRLNRTLALATVLALALVALLGRPDPTPALNVSALALARDPARAPVAIALLRASLAQNPDQEIAHFNLGWLLLVSDPAAAERHFIEAIHLVPDKGGVYFGLGLARLNQARPAEAARAFALECLNDPAFLFSPWWRESGLAPHLPATRLAFAHLATHAQKNLPRTSWAATQLTSVAALAPRLGDFPAGPERTYRRERTAYPVLTRDVNLAPPLDLYDVRELSTPPSTPAPLPPKSWLPTPLLLELLDAPASPPLRH